MKERLDTVLHNRGLFPSREKANAAVMAGVVYVNGRRVEKAGTRIDPQADLEVRQNSCPYVGRGGLKLAAALETFCIDLAGKTTVDIGASTGGFTDCMLQQGAACVYAVDVGYGQLDWKLRNDPRVVNFERTNIRYLDPQQIPEPADFITIDVSFISLRLVLPVATRLLSAAGQILCLVKPQFEAGREQVGRKGIIRDPAVHREVLGKMAAFAAACGLVPAGLTWSPVKGAKGNIEFLLLLERALADGESPGKFENQIRAVVTSAHQTLSGF